MLKPLAAILVAAVVLAGCLAPGGGAGPSASAAASTLTTSAAPVVSAEDAAARAIATDPRFAGATQLQPNSIGLSKWWESAAGANGGFAIKITLGSGDCPAGCISRHTWLFDVAADGTVTPVGDAGDPVPTNL